MALTGLHVVCGYAGGRSSAGSGVIDLLGRALWSETLSSPGSTTKVVPDGEAPNTFCLSLRSSVDAWVAIGASPDAVSGTKRYLVANSDVDLIVNSGEKLAWTVA